MNSADRAIENFDARHFEKEVQEERAREYRDAMKDEYVISRTVELLTNLGDLKNAILDDLIFDDEFLTDLAAFNSEMLDIMDAKDRGTEWEHKAMAVFADMYHCAKCVAENEWGDEYE